MKQATLRVRIDQDIEKALKQEAKVLGITFSEVVRKRISANNLMIPHVIKKGNKLVIEIPLKKGKGVAVPP